jgi:hypothetical protein
VVGDKLVVGEFLDDVIDKGPPPGGRRRDRREEVIKGSDERLECRRRAVGLGSGLGGPVALDCGKDWVTRRQAGRPGGGRLLASTSPARILRRVASIAGTSTGKKARHEAGLEVCHSVFGTPSSLAGDGGTNGGLTACCMKRSSNCTILVRS